MTEPCPSCAQPVPASARFCAGCGAPASSRSRTAAADRTSVAHGRFDAGAILAERI